MADAIAGYGIHDEASVASERPSRSVGGAYHVGEVAGPSRWAHLNGRPGAFTEAANLVESGDDMSRRIPPNMIKFGDGSCDVGQSEPFIRRPCADCKSLARVDFPALDRQAVPIGVTGESSCGAVATLRRGD